MPWTEGNDPKCTHDSATGEVVRSCACGAVERREALPRDQVFLGDCLAVLRALPGNSVDSLVTDPPAGIEFMGAEWDTFKQGRLAEYTAPPQGTMDAVRTEGASFKDRMGANPAVRQQANRRCLLCGRYAYSGSPCRCPDPEWAPDTSTRDTFVAFMEAAAREIYRVLKPGAFGVVWAIPRTSHWTATALENAGFEIRDRIAHIFGQGFPKSLNVSKALDRVGGALPEEQAELLRTRREAMGWTRDHLASLVGCKPASVRDWEEGRARKKGGEVEYVIPSAAYRKKLAEHLGYSEDERRMVGLVKKRKGDGTVGALGHSGQLTDDQARTELAKQWQGWGTSLKPGVEDWWLIRKPLSGSVADTVTKHGTGAINIDGCRVHGPQGNGHWSGDDRSDQTSLPGYGGGFTQGGEQSAKGRWPSNLVLTHAPGCRQVGTQQVAAPTINRFTDGAKPFGGGAGHPYESSGGGTQEQVMYECEPGCPVSELDSQSGTLSSGVGAVRRKPHETNSMAASLGGPRDTEEVCYGDTGGASRYFQTFECEPGCPVAALNEQSGDRPVGWVSGAQARGIGYGSGADASEADGSRPSRALDGEGGAAKFFQTFEPQYDAPFVYNGKITTRERNEGFDTVGQAKSQHSMEDASISTQSNRRCVLCGKVKFGQPHCECPEPEWEETQGSKSLNHHPTVKPVKLMRYFCRLVTPKGGTLLDPFAGSGSTLVAAVEEGFHFVGIEKHPPYYHEITVPRVQYALRVAQGVRSEREGFEAMFDLPSE